MTINAASQYCFQLSRIIELNGLGLDLVNLLMLS